MKYDRPIAGPLWEKKDLISGFTDRELAVFRLIGEGQGTRQIAVRLKLSFKTIETIRARVIRQLDKDFRRVRRGML